MDAVPVSPAGFSFPPGAVNLYVDALCRADHRAIMVVARTNMGVAYGRYIDRGCCDRSARFISKYIHIRNRIP